MEKIRRAPAVAHLPLTVDAGTCRDFEFDLLEIVAEKRGGDLSVRADGIFSVNGLKIADRCIDGTEVFGDFFCRHRDL